MLTRLKVKGFKNLADAEITFGPFTCIAGANAVGKSNLFDAIMFLRDLANLPIIEAAAKVRDPLGKSGDITSLFQQSRLGISKEIEFDCDLIVPLEVLDDFGRSCKPSISYLNYKVSFSLEVHDSAEPRIVLSKEELSYIQKGDASSRLGFRHTPKFRNSIVTGRRTTPLISFSDDDQEVIKLHQDGGSSGLPFRVKARNSPRTVLGGTNTIDQPTVLAARREMQSWMLLQLEPSALRNPDEFSADPHLSASGEHMPSTLARLGTDAVVATDLADLLPDIRSVSVDVDSGRRRRTLNVETREGVVYPARALSDGTLRFLALALLRSDNEAGRLICLEEPENGIHPSRIDAILELLQGIAVDAKEPVDEINPLRQVVINTHSPVVVRALPTDCLVIAKAYVSSSGNFTQFQALPDTWRTSQTAAYPMQSASLGDLIGYLGEPYRDSSGKTGVTKRKETVLDFASKQGVLPFMLDKKQ